MHKVDLVSKNINDENMFYTVYCEIFKKVKSNTELLVTIVRRLYDMLISKKYSYIKNRAIFPYQRVFAMGLFTIFNG